MEILTRSADHNHFGVRGQGGVRASCLKVSVFLVYQLEDTKQSYCGFLETFATRSVCRGGREG